MGQNVFCVNILLNDVHLINGNTSKQSKQLIYHTESNCGCNPKQKAVKKCEANQKQHRLYCLIK